jgi:YjbR
MKKKTAAPSPDTYRRLALALPGAVESSHMGAPDFRINDRIFATLAYGAKSLGTLKLTPEQQAEFLAEAPEYFTPAPGGWGRMGMTLVRLDAPESVLSGALSTAFHTVLSKQAPKKKASR